MCKLRYLKFVICGVIIALSMCISYRLLNPNYDINNVNVVLQVDTKESYDYTINNGLDVAKLYYKKKDITHIKKGFSVGYSYNKKSNTLVVYLMNKKQGIRKVEIQLED